MGSLPRPKLSPEQIVAHYLAGESLGLLSLKARLPTSRVREILVGNGVRIRQAPEAIRLELRLRPRRVRNRTLKISGLSL